MLLVRIILPHVLKGSMLLKKCFIRVQWRDMFEWDIVQVLVEVRGLRNLWSGGLKDPLGSSFIRDCNQIDLWDASLIKFNCWEFPSTLIPPRSSLSWAMHLNISVMTILVMPTFINAAMTPIPGGALIATGEMCGPDDTCTGNGRCIVRCCRPEVALPDNVAECREDGCAKRCISEYEHVPGTGCVPKGKCD